MSGSKAGNQWGARLSGFMYIECIDCGEKHEADVIDGKVTFPEMLYWVAVPYNGDTEHLDPVCWDCAQATYGEANRVKPRATKPKARKRTATP